MPSDRILDRIATALEMMVALRLEELGSSGSKTSSHVRDMNLVLRRLFSHHADRLGNVDDKVPLEVNTQMWRPIGTAPLARIFVGPVTGSDWMITSPVPTDTVGSYTARLASQGYTHWHPLPTPLTAKNDQYEEIG